MSLYYSSEIRKLFSQISLKKQEIEQLRSKESLTAEDENAIIDNAIEIARLEVKISERQEKEANDSFNYGLPPGLIGFQVVEKRFVPRTDSLDESFEINMRSIPDELEDESKDSLEEYNSYLYFKLDNPNRPTKDFSALGLFLSKAVENEINHSLVQMIRKCHGIEMPDYYCKVKDGIGPKMVKSGNKYLDLNATSTEHGGLCQLALGDACFLWHQMRENSTKYSDFISFDNDDKLHENCLRLIKLRNNFVAHSKPTEWGDFCEVFNCFQNIMKYHIPNLMEVKNLMRAKGHCH